MKVNSIQRLRSSTERYPIGALTAFGRRGSLVVWSSKPRAYTMANGHKVLPNKGKVVLRGQA
jgi:hypothetical protein